VKGPIIGATIEGSIDTVANQVRMSGTFVPMYGLNNMFGQIPVLGLFLGNGNNEGLIGVTYEVVGTPGAPVLLFLSAEAQGDEIRARIQSAEPLDQAASKLQKGLRVFLRSDQPIEGVAKRLEPARSTPDKGDAEVSMILILEGGASEVEVKLPGRYKVSPQIAGAIKAVPGVIEVQAM